MSYETKPVNTIEREDVDEKWMYRCLHILPAFREPLTTPQGTESTPLPNTGKRPVQRL